MVNAIIIYVSLRMVVYGLVDDCMIVQPHSFDFCFAEGPEASSTSECTMRFLASSQQKA